MYLVPLVFTTGKHMTHSSCLAFACFPQILPTSTTPPLWLVCAWMLRIRSTWTVCCHLDEITKPTLDGCILPSLDTHQQLERVLGGHVLLRRLGAQRTCLECHQDSPKVACDALPSLPQPPTALRTPQTPPPPPTHPPTSAPTVPLTCRPQGVHRLVHSMPRPRDSRWALERHYVSNSPINFLTLNISSKS